MKENKKNSNSYLAKGNSELIKGNYILAIDFFKKAINKNPSLKSAVDFNIKLANSRLNKSSGIGSCSDLNDDKISSVFYSSKDNEIKSIKDGKSITTVDDEYNCIDGVFNDVLQSLKSSKDYSSDFDLFLQKNELKIRGLLNSTSMQWNPLISIIMPSFNRAEIIELSIRSVLEQSYTRFELIVCDDGSSDDTEAVVLSINDDRIKYFKQENKGAAAARNKALENSRGEVIAYLDSDNYWHPNYLELLTCQLANHKGSSAVYFDFVDYRIDSNNAIHLRYDSRPDFDHERLLQKPFIDLNTFAHRRELYDAFGGFDENLVRRQDYDLMLKYTWLRDPVHIPINVALYQRNDGLVQISRACRNDMSPIKIINQKVESYLQHGLPMKNNDRIRKVSVIIWDICRNHFSKPFSVAEALSAHYEVELISFDFFNEGVFEPLREVKPPFETKYFRGADFPDFFTMLRAGMDAVKGDVMYVVKPRLPSLGLAMLVNYERAIPFALEINDLETVVNSPKEGDKHLEVSLDDVKLTDKELLNPYSGLWSTILDPISKDIPTVITHNQGLDKHYMSKSLYMRNLKDEAVYSPANYDREKIREELGFNIDDRIILFGGLLRKHKGIYELVELVQRLGDKRYKLLFVGSRPTPDQAKLVEQYKSVITVLPPQDRVGMARINLAADLVILWLNPEVPASHYQFPYKATDAFAMETPVIANDISDLGELGRQGYLSLVDFGDWDAMVDRITQLFADDKIRNTQIKAARRLFLRQFSFNAARGNFGLVVERLQKESQNAYDVSIKFANWFETFHTSVMKDKSVTSFLNPKVSRNLRLTQSYGMHAPSEFGETEFDERIYFVKPDEIMSLSHRLAMRKDQKIISFVLSSRTDTALIAARLLAKRSDHPIDVVVLDASHSQDQAFRAALHLLELTSYTYVVFVDEHAFPCRNWLEFGYKELIKPKFEFVFVNNGTMFEPKLSASLPEYFLTTRLGAIDLISNTTETLNWLTVSKSVRDTGRFHRSGRCLIANMATLSVECRNYLPGNEIHVVDVKSLDKKENRFTQDICVVMPCINHALGMRTADLLQSRAGIQADYVIANDTKRQGFIKTLNQVALCSSAKYIVYLAEDAFPGENWLKIAHEELEKSKKGLLAFNCGKWHGRVAAFGMVRTEWVAQVYDNQILFDGYKAHRADNEIAVIAKAQNQFVYAAESILFENDPSKDFKKNESEAGNFTVDDKKLFKKRYKDVLPTFLNNNKLDDLYDHYLNQQKIASEKTAFVII
ncbi:glycosyltransferase [Vibrio metschnikovii]|uniref:glycosyltransferase n=1 Tax=Vibrio metschnikovii TaxID=28172 RepID=UPI001C3015A9|nr:glycosyltransferase [Vibrio metschnikovii]